MKKYSIEVKTSTSELWDSEAVQDRIEAESGEEAIEFAKDYLKEGCKDNAEDPSQVDEWAFRANEI